MKKGIKAVYLKHGKAEETSPLESRKAKRYHVFGALQISTLGSHPPIIET